jgi:hypothetical protein
MMTSLALALTTCASPLPQSGDGISLTETFGVDPAVPSTESLTVEDISLSEGTTAVDATVTPVEALPSDDEVLPSDDQIGAGAESDIPDSPIAVPLDLALDSSERAAASSSCLRPNDPAEWARSGGEELLTDWLQTNGTGNYRCNYSGYDVLTLSRLVAQQPQFQYHEAG